MTWRATHWRPSRDEHLREAACEAQAKLRGIALGGAAHDASINRAATSILNISSAGGSPRRANVTMPKRAVEIMAGLSANSTRSGAAARIAISSA